jgi:Secretion system C-terminal sorting domain
LNSLIGEKPFIRKAGYMKRHTLVLVLFLSGVALSGIWAQDAVLSAGGDGTSFSGSVSYSVGQVAYTSQSSPGGVVSAGVQQPVKVIMVGSNELLPNVTLGIYPNPTKDKLILELSGEYPIRGQYSFSLYDLCGKLLLQERITGSSVSVPLNDFTNGMYLLKVSLNNDVIKTFKVIKTN